MSKSYYKKDDPTKIVTIVDDKQQGYYELSNGQMIKKDIFSKYYSLQENVQPVNESFNLKKISSSDFVDPDSFFTKPALQLNQKDIINLKNADPEKGAIEGADRTEFIVNTSDKTKGAIPILNEKAGQSFTSQPTRNESIIQEVDETKLPIPNNTNIDVSQYKVFENEDDAYADFINKGNNPQPVQQTKPVQQPKVQVDEIYEDEKMVYGVEEANRRRDIRLRKTSQSTIESPQLINTEQKIIQPQMIDPTELMFKTFKRNHDIQINVVFNEKIGNPEFIRMMMENMEGDIVGYYKKLIIDDINKNFKTIEDEVERQIKEHIFGQTPINVIENSAEIISKLTTLANQLVDKSNEITFLDDLDENLLDKHTTVDNFDFGDEVKLIPGGTSPAGKQLYKYIDEKGKVRESLPRSANKKGWKPLIKES